MATSDVGRAIPVGSCVHYSRPFVLTVLANVIQAYVVLIMLPTAILSWFRIDPRSTLGQVQRFLYRATEPVLAPVRRIIRPMGGLDISFIVVFLVAEFVAIPLLGGATIL
jgi:YggT family protein